MTTNINAMIAAALARLMPYQAAFAANPSRFKIGLWARQTGKDHTCTFEAVADSLRNPGTLWMIVAASERQARESLAKAREWAELVQLPIDDYSEELPAPAARLQSAEIRWANGSRLLALPANPHTIRGYSANLILTEFAFHENPAEIWRAIYPSISNPLRGGLKKLRIISTPNGLNNKFAQLWQNAAVYCKSFLTVHDAIAQGLPLDAADLRAGLDDEDAWQQEYLCQFMDTSSVLLPYELIESCESPEASLTLLTPPGFAASSDASSPAPAATAALSRLHGELFAGIDFGRKHHLTVCWLFQRLNNRLVTREVLTLKNLSTPDQIEILRPRLQRCRKASIDYTGPGIGLGDYLVKEFGEWNPSQPVNRSNPPGRGHGKVELCQFTPALKAELFPRLRAAFEQRALLIPSSTEIREDLHAIHRVISLHGHDSYRAIATPDGHSDRCTALALALRAAQNTSTWAPPVVIPRPSFYERQSRRGIQPSLRSTRHPHAAPETTLLTIY